MSLISEFLVTTQSLVEVYNLVREIHFMHGSISKSSAPHVSSPEQICRLGGACKPQAGRQHTYHPAYTIHGDD
jgi:hypothetical protein